MRVQNVIENPYRNKRPMVSYVVPFEDIRVASINKDKGTRRHGGGHTRMSKAGSFTETYEGSMNAL